MIINLRGTGGSGKSTIVRKVMETYPIRTPAYIQGRKQPISYLCQRFNPADAPEPGSQADHYPHRSERHAFQTPPLVVLGHYETPCGGTDTITKPDDVFRLVREANASGYDVLFEGIIVGDDVKRTAALHLDGLGLMVVALNTPLEECFRGIQARRDQRGDERPLDTKNTIGRAERLKRNMSRLKESRVDTRWLSRDDALALVLATFERTAPVGPV